MGGYEHRHGTLAAQAAEQLEDLRDRGHDSVVALLLAAAARHVSADLTFLDDAEAELLAPGALERLAPTGSGTTPSASAPGPRSAKDRAAS